MADPPQSPRDESVYFWSCNRGKRSIAINLSTESGSKLIARLAGECDVLIENYKVGTLRRYGLDYATLAKN